jgi:hypothetical protein
MNIFTTNLVVDIKKISVRYFKHDNGETMCMVCFVRCMMDIERPLVSEDK